MSDNSITFQDHFSPVAVQYARYRPTYPSALFQLIAGNCYSQKRAWDCATGNGQAAIGLSKHFFEVIATDASAGQIQYAAPRKNITYRVARAEASGIEAHSVDAITVAQALHWLDFDKFYAEVERVSKPGALLAVWAYGQSKINPDIDHLVEQFHSQVIGQYWAKERRFVEEHYQSIPFPFQELHIPPFEIKRDMNLSEYIGYLSTWSAYQKCVKENGTAVIQPFLEKITQMWGAPDSRKTAKAKLHVRIGRVKEERTLEDLIALK